MGGPIGLSIRGAARLYGVSHVTVRAAIAANELPAARIGRRRLLILRTDLDAWIRKHQLRPSTDDVAVVDRVLERERAQEEARKAG